LFSPPVVGAPVDVPRVPRRTLRRSLRGAFVGCGSPSAPLVLRPFSSTALCASAVLHARGQPSLSSPTYDCLNRSQPWSHRPLTCIAGPLATRRATPTRSGPRRNTGKDPRQRSRRRRRRGRGKRPASRPNVTRTSRNAAVSSKESTGSSSPRTTSRRAASRPRRARDARNAAARARARRRSAAVRELAASARRRTAGPTRAPWPTLARTTAGTTARASRARAWHPRATGPRAAKAARTRCRACVEVFDGGTRPTET
ncbi:hypothetical protein DMC30DRAFT_443735, partial [Rhodotorula diobovata]